MTEDYPFGEATEAEDAEIDAVVADLAARLCQSSTAVAYVATVHSLGEMIAHGAPDPEVALNVAGDHCRILIDRVTARAIELAALREAERETRH